MSELPYEKHSHQIIEACPTLDALENPNVEQTKRLAEIRDDCLKWCIQEWDYSLQRARNVLLAAQQQMQADGPAVALLRRLRQWDMLHESSWLADAPYWRNEIDAVLKTLDRR